jgi:hypothetical protein
MATRGVINPHDAISSCRFLEYAPPKVVLSFFTQHPGLFLDGKYWDDPFDGIDFGNQAATDEARARVVRHYENLIADAAWLSDQDPGDLLAAPKSRLHRAALALSLLEPSSTTEE